MTVRYIIGANPNVGEVSNERFKHLAFGGVIESIPIIPYSFSGEGGTRIDKVKAELKGDRVMIGSFLTVHDFLALTNRKRSTLNAARSYKMINADGFTLVAFFGNIGRNSASKFIIKIIGERI